MNPHEQATSDPARLTDSETGKAIGSAESLSSLPSSRSAAPPCERIAEIQKLLDDGVHGFIALQRDDIKYLLAQHATLIAEREEARSECGRWKEAAYKKARTWECMQSMHRAGDSVDMLAAEYGVPVEWVTWLMFPENDLDARYGRPSDRTRTAKANRDAALIELREVKAERFRLLAQLEAAESALDEARKARDEMEARFSQQLPADAAKALHDHAWELYDDVGPSPVIVDPPAQGTAKTKDEKSDARIGQPDAVPSPQHASTDGGKS
jgi:hypothetical protein